MARKTRNKIVMIVEDDASRRKIIYEILKAAGVDLISALTGEEAMSRIPREQPDLVLVNMHSKRVRGIDFIKELRMYGMGQKIKVVAMTGEDKQTRNNAKAAGADDLIDRNLNPHEIVDLMGKHLGIEEFNLPREKTARRGVREEDCRGKSRKQAGGKRDNQPRVVRQLTEDAGKKKI